LRIIAKRHLYSNYLFKTLSATTDIVQKLWNLCHVLRDDGITYLDYVTELTYLLFLKMAQETGTESQIPEGCRWGDLVVKDGIEQMNFYRATLLELGSKNTPLQVQAIFANAQTALKKPQILNKLVKSIDELDWYSAKSEGLGDLYEGLLEKNASEKKSGAGQYFTPRPLIDCMVELIKPQAGELVQDPAAGTGGFLIAGDRYIKKHTDDLFDLSEAEQSFQRYQASTALN
jgi:type I restriction enzyme M protein